MTIKERKKLDRMLAVNPETQNRIRIQESMQMNHIKWLEKNRDKAYEAWKAIDLDDNSTDQEWKEAATELNIAYNHWNQATSEIIERG